MPASDRDAALAAAEREGVDLSLLRQRLRLTPTERVERHGAALALVFGLRAAGRHARSEDAADGAS